MLSARGVTGATSGSIGRRRSTSNTCNASRKRFRDPALQREYQIFTLLTSQRIADKIYHPSRKQHWHAKLWRVKGDTMWHAKSFEFPEATATGKTKAEVREKLLDAICYRMIATQKQARNAADSEAVAPVTSTRDEVRSDRVTKRA